MGEQHKRIHLKLSHGEQTTHSVDRLSDLPDSLLCHILSFLPTKISVATSILARRWRFLWAYVPNLNFHHDKEDSINRVLLLHKSQTINTFRLREGNGSFWEDNDQFEKWIMFAIERNVKSINMFLCMAKLPPCLYTCKTLVDLTIDSKDVLPKSGHVFLPLLKKLHLFYVHHYGYDTLLSGCPVLEELLIHSCANYDSFIISSPTIKRLMIGLYSEGDESNNKYDLDYEDLYKLEINTPALVYLYLADDSAQHIKCGPLNSLIEADIDIEGYIDDDGVYARCVVEFIDRLRNAKFLKFHLSHYTKPIQSAFCARTISFHNLVKLELTSDCPFSLKFLEDADNLEILILQEVRAHRAMIDCEVIGCMEPQQVPTCCLLSRLRTAKLVGIRGNLYELQIISYLLRNAKVMEEMEIVYSRYLVPDQKINMLEEIQTFQRGSSVCKVKFFQG